MKKRGGEGGEIGEEGLLGPVLGVSIQYAWAGKKSKGTIATETDGQMNAAR